MSRACLSAGYGHSRPDLERIDQALTEIRRLSCGWCLFVGGPCVGNQGLLFHLLRYSMKKAIVAAIAVAFFVSTAAEARGGRGFSGGRSFSRPAPTKSYAPKRTTVVKKNTTVINQTVNQSAPASSGGGFWSTVAGSFAGSMAGNAVYDAVTDDKGQEPAPAQ